jgi:hypothetical protein
MPIFLRSHFSLIVPPKVPLGACLTGSSTLGKFVKNQGFKVKYCYFPQHGSFQGHVWILAQKSPPGWMAIDPCLNKIEDWHYSPPIVVDEIEDIIKLIPSRVL